MLFTEKTKYTDKKILLKGINGLYMEKRRSIILVRYGILASTRSTAEKVSEGKILCTNQPACFQCFVLYFQ